MRYLTMLLIAAVLSGCSPRVRPTVVTDRNRVDSVDVPVPYPVEVPVEMEKPLSWWQTALMWAGAAGLLVACIQVGQLTGRPKK